MLAEEAARLTDAQARNLVIKALRAARRAYRHADTLGEVEERDLDRLIKRKTKINATQLVILSKKYKAYQDACNAVQVPLTDAYNLASVFGS